MVLLVGTDEKVTVQIEKADILARIEQRINSCNITLQVMNEPDTPKVLQFTPTVYAIISELGDHHDANR
jgi:hypothetical protein